MNIIRGLHNLTNLSGSVVTIGNFDGVHIGHQQIISRLVAQAKILNLPSVLISFSPTPQSFFGRDQALLTSFKQKQLLLEKLGLDTHLIITFNQPFSKLSADDFIQKILLEKLGMKFCLIGDDFRFGSGRTGNFKLLQSFAQQYAFEVESTPSVLCYSQRASSTKIRTFLAQGALPQASQMLGRDFAICGKIIHGKQLGRTIDFPTINIPIKRNISPVLGVFAVQVQLLGKTFNGVCNIGKRPTVNGENILLEVFLFNFKKTVYGEFANVIFKQQIREEQKFDSFEQLKEQIKLDTEIAKDFFQQTLN
ncbi:bifunctional riboflavin kinase/FAD synthetase [Candidatus Thioglobus autotrophicus]|uniref:bifunctional riboflavin kinase/FAD synthetase n=1 Tax=Candidatus Thioglobus autotrophicus TaxID=1705394 RepID=UPI00299D011E|nr:bifunctional riboflavin kinase/FAD synthetase [Candidatus Thioglobus autotrophicus]WPE16490.1 bifunctional riboflavin kinase/FAD synthetase [Candidatus Thioglobus autotrophicus]